MKREDLQGKNSSELKDMLRAVERELKRREEGPKVITYFVTTCITDHMRFKDINYALEYLQFASKGLHEYVCEDPDNQAYVNRCTAIVGVKFQVIEMEQADYEAREKTGYFADESWENERKSFGFGKST